LRRAKTKKGSRDDATNTSSRGEKKSVLIIRGIEKKKDSIFQGQDKGKKTRELQNTSLPHHIEKKEKGQNSKQFIIEFGSEVVGRYEWTKNTSPPFPPSHRARKECGVKRHIAKQKFPLPTGMRCTEKRISNAGFIGEGVREPKSRPTDLWEGSEE